MKNNCLEKHSYTDHFLYIYPIDEKVKTAQLD